MTPTTTTTAAAPPPKPPLARSILRALRPKQWTKNAIILVPVVFAQSALEARAGMVAVLAVVAFSLLSSAVYVMNDWHDREEDLLHPTKRYRPIASGALSPPLVFGLAAVCTGTSAALGWIVGPRFLAILGGYVAFQLIYTGWLKHLVIVDVMSIAFGFLLRIYAGAAAVGVAVSNWLILCALFLAVFLGFAKRRAEITVLGDDAAQHRKNLGEYSIDLLDQMMNTSAACAVLAYALYTVAPETIGHVGSDGLKFTVPFVVYGIFRYLFLIHRRSEGGAPEQVLLSDRPLQIAIVLFTAIAAWALYVAPRL